MRPRARIVHRTAQRLRLKIAERRRDLDYFLRLYEHLRRLPGVAEVQADPLTGTALLHLDTGAAGAELSAALAQSPLFQLDDASPPMAPSPLGHG